MRSRHAIKCIKSVHECCSVKCLCAHPPPPMNPLISAFTGADRWSAERVQSRIDVYTVCLGGREQLFRQVVAEILSSALNSIARPLSSQASCLSNYRGIVFGGRCPHIAVLCSMIPPLTAVLFQLINCL